MPNPDVASEPLDARARAYLAANCGNCHRPGVQVDAEINLTWEAADLNAIGVEPLRGTAGLPEGARLIVPGQPERSVLLARMTTLAPAHRMPRLGSAVVDAAGVSLIQKWILAMPRPFLRGDCDGDGTASGSVTDAVFLLAHNFGGGEPPPCLAGCDADGDGRVQGVVTDAIYMLSFSFLGGPAPRPPYPDCGAGNLPGDAVLGCAGASKRCP